MDKIRVSIIDDHDLVRSGLVQFLKAFPDIEVVSEASSGDGLLEKLRAAPVDVLLLDMSMPGQCGNSLIASINKTSPGVRILIVSGQIEAQVVLHAIQAGASGYISKEHSPQILLDAIRQVAATGKYLSPQMANQLRNTHCAFCQLSPRELEAARLYANGLSHKEIAQKLNITPHTARRHIGNIFTKLGIQNKAELIKLIPRSGHFS